jgi:ABC-type multidrug transport system fused ATPase/permease subunit
MAIVPQEPVLFAGSLRDAIDPLHAATLEEVEAAIEACGLHHVAQRPVSHPLIR